MDTDGSATGSLEYRTLAGALTLPLIGYNVLDEVTC